ncbi:MAG: 4Fe-4S binding protein [Candidatus Syntropharchaeia archaeon]
MEEVKIGVYVCHCGINIAATVDVKRVAEFASTLPGVVIARDYQYMCSDPGQELIKEDIRELGLNRVVVASCSPRMHEPTYRTVVEEAGGNPYCFEMANIREQCSWVHKNKEEATKKACSLVASAVARASLLEPLESREVDVIPACLVIGGGVSGIYAALGMADKGFKVYLVECEPSIGGHMAQLDKTFPTLDCSACILTPKMVDVGRHPNIELLTYSEVEEIDGFVGNFHVKIRKKPRYVDEKVCTGCGACAEVCPVYFKSEFDMGLGVRKGAYVPFPQAVPLKYTLELDKCMRCGLCKLACEAGAIDYDQREEIVEVDVGAIIVATGYETFDPSTEPNYGYGLPNVITGLEFERLINASGPTGGKVLLEDGSYPKRVVLIQCVGSREIGGREYCSRFCCMYTAKHAHLIREKIPDAEVTILYTDVRAFGKGFEEFYNRVKREGIKYIWRDLEKPIEVKEGENGLKITAEGFERIELDADLVILATAVVPSSGARKIGNILKLPQSPDGFFLESHPKLRPIDTPSDGIFLAGCCQGPKDIPDSVAQACGTAARAAISLFRGKVPIEVISSQINEEICSGCRMCEEVCAYGALSFDEEKEIMTVNEVLCKGCGSCSTTCPSGAASMRHYRDSQIFAQIEAVIG